MYCNIYNDADAADATSDAAAVVVVVDVAGARAWNFLLSTLRAVPSLTSFRSHLKQTV